MSTQLSLWDAKAADTLELSFSWADGDTNREQLERLATLLQGNLQALRDDTGHGHCVRVLSTRIEDGKVWGTCEQVLHPYGKPAQDADEEDEDEDDC